MQERMSDESSLKSDTPCPLGLTLEIPTTDSTTSSTQSSLTSLTSSPIGILDSSTAITTADTTASCSSLPIHTPSRAQLNVKFAPLPQLAPRKRRSTAPLGMAARTQLVRRKRHQHQYYDPDPGPRYNANESPMWTEEELAEARMRQVAAAVERERERKRREFLEKSNADEDPFLVFGRMVKGASKHIWKKVAKKDKREQREKGNAEGEDGQNEEGPGEDGDRDNNTNTSRSVPSTPVATSSVDSPIRGSPPRIRPLLDSDEPEFEEAGRVWEEEIGKDFLQRVGQTETIIEGRTKYLKDPEEADFATVPINEVDGPVSDSITHKKTTESPPAPPLSSLVDIKTS